MFLRGKKKKSVYVSCCSLFMALYCFWVFMNVWKCAGVCVYDLDQNVKPLIKTGF